MGQYEHEYDSAGAFDAAQGEADARIEQERYAFEFLRGLLHTNRDEAARLYLGLRESVKVRFCGRWLEEDQVHVLAYAVEIHLRKKSLGGDQ